MFKAVLDANQYVSALIISQGASAQLIRKAREGQFIIVLSASILEEIYRALTYPRVKKYLLLNAEEIDDFFSGLIEVSQIVEGGMHVQVVKDDPDDDKYVACALEGQADCIVSGDKHLLNLKAYESIKILTARELLGLLG